MIPPLLPFQYYQYQRGLHYTEARFFPLSYVRAVLALDVAYDVEDDTSVEDIVAFFKARGVDYATIHADFYRAAGERHQQLARWRRDTFTGAVAFDDEGNKTLLRFSDEERTMLQPVPDGDADAAINADKMRLQNYGRPLNSDGKPSGTYYKFAKKTVCDVVDF